MKTQILNHAKKCSENECCGFVIDNKIYMPCNNVSPTPTETFEISPDDWIKAEEKGNVTAIVHSHPDGEPILSEADQIFQQQTALDWWLVCDNKIHQFRYIKPLLGREFEHGKNDCLTIANHAAIYIGNQQILHHCPNRLSKRDAYGGFWIDYTHSIWRHKKWQKLGYTAILNNMATSSI